MRLPRTPRVDSASPVVMLSHGAVAGVLTGGLATGAGRRGWVDTAGIDSPYRMQASAASVRSSTIVNGRRFMGRSAEFDSRDNTNQWAAPAMKTSAIPEGPNCHADTTKEVIPRKIRSNPGTAKRLTLSLVSIGGVYGFCVTVVASGAYPTNFPEQQAAGVESMALRSGPRHWRTAPGFVPGGVVLAWQLGFVADETNGPNPSSSARRLRRATNRLIFLATSDDLELFFR